MAVHMEGKAQGDDLGAYGSWFDRGYEGSPAPMPKFISEKGNMINKDKDTNVNKMIPTTGRCDPQARIYSNQLCC